MYSTLSGADKRKPKKIKNKKQQPFSVRSTFQNHADARRAAKAVNVPAAAAWILKSPKSPSITLPPTPPIGAVDIKRGSRCQTQWDKKGERTASLHPHPSLSRHITRMWRDGGADSANEARSRWKMVKYMEGGRVWGWGRGQSMNPLSAPVTAASAAAAAAVEEVRLHYGGDGWAALYRLTLEVARGARGEQEAESEVWLERECGSAEARGRKGRSRSMVEALQSVNAPYLRSYRATRRPIPSH